MDVLVVDDDDVIGRCMARLAKLEGLDCEHVTTCQEAMRLLLDAPDKTVAVVDLRIGAKSGLDLVEALRKRGDERPVLLMSGSRPELGPDEKQRYRIAGFLAKPFTGSDLAAAVRLASVAA